MVCYNFINKDMNEKYNVYLVSDSTGETLDRIFLSLKSQFANFEYEKKEFAFIRTEQQIDKIIKKSREVLKKSIVKGGSSIRDFKNTSGNRGLFQNEFKVYNRENLKCPRITCRGKIFKIVVTNRSSFFCNKCQK